MNGLIATPESKPGILENDGWFPNIDVARVRATMRLDGTVTGPRLEDALKSAVLEINDALAVWKADMIAKGHGDLAAIPVACVGGESRYQILYRKAVSACATATLIERYRGVDASAEASGKDDGRRPTIDELRRDQHNAVNDILGHPRCVVDLI